MKRRQPPRVPSGLPSVNGDRREVYDGSAHVGTIAERGGHWKAIGRGSHDVGLFETAPEAARALVTHHRSVRSSH